MQSIEFDISSAVRLLTPALFAVLAGCGGHATAVSPSALIAKAATFDGQDVNVTGMVKNPTAHQFRRGYATTYQICDNACVNVLQFGTANVSDGDQQTVNGTFHQAFGRRRFHMQHVVVVGGRSVLRSETSGSAHHRRRATRLHERAYATYCAADPTSAIAISRRCGDPLSPTF